MMTRDEGMAIALAEGWAVYSDVEDLVMAVASAEREACAKVCDVLHAAICQAVATMNISPEIARNSSLREAHNCLRQVLVDFAEHDIRARRNKGEAG